jgi:hypothetical protein
VRLLPILPAMAIWFSVPISPSDPVSPTDQIMDLEQLAPALIPLFAPGRLIVQTLHLEQLAPAPIPLFAPGSLAAQTPQQEQRVDQEQRVMSAEESMALQQWARRHLEETQARGEGEGHHIPTEMERLRAMYFLSVEDRSWVVKATDLLETLEETLPPQAPQGIILEAYRGALETVRAKHARWPPTKLRHLREGVGTLDRLVADEPGNLEVRYLRLVSCYYLPFFLKREESVQEDFRVLVSNLPHHPEAFSPPVYRGVVQFVLDKGNPDEGERALLLDALRSAADGSLSPSPVGSPLPVPNVEASSPRKAPGPGPGEPT